MFQAKQKSPLFCNFFDEVGGYPALQGVLRLLDGKLFAHPWLKGFFVHSGRAIVEVLQTDFRAALMGGPNRYGGRLTATLTPARLLVLGPVLFAAAVAPARADEEASNIPHVVAGTWGRCYAKSVPDDYYGERGATRLYEVGREADRLIATYPWFAQQIHLQCNMVRDGQAGASLVRLGPWPRGRRASADQLALAFYFDGEELERYTTLDLAGRPDNVEASVSHYRVIAEVPGYRWIGGEAPNDYVFEVRTVDGRLLSFDPRTGKPLVSGRN